MKRELGGKRAFRFEAVANQIEGECGFDTAKQRGYFCLHIGIQLEERERRRQTREGKENNCQHSVNKMWADSVMTKEGAIFFSMRDVVERM